MSGIYGFMIPKGISEPKSLLEKMRFALPVTSDAKKGEWTNPSGTVGLGALHPARIGDTGHYSEDREKGICCVVDGVLYHGEKIELEPAAYLLKALSRSGKDCLPKISGSFNLAYWDEDSERLIIATDRIGHRLLFYGHEKGHLIFSSLLARIMASQLITPDVDVEAFSDLISYEYVLGARTLFRNIKTLPPASILTFHRGQIEIEKYWFLEQIVPQGHYDEDRLDELEALFRTAVKRTIRPGIKTAIDLTGGLDSRCILAAAKNMNLPFIAHTGGQDDSTDVVLARQAAALVGVQHFFEPVGPEKVADWLTPMVCFQGGIVATLHSHPCQHFEMQLPFDAAVQGIGATYMRGHWVSPDNLEIDNRRDAQAYLKSRISSDTARRFDLKKLWLPKYQSIGLTKPDEHLSELFDQSETHDRYVAVLDGIALRERCRKFLNKAILIARGEREMYFPYLDHELIVALAAIPIEYRVTNKIHIDLIKRFYPSLLNIASAKNLIPMNASASKEKLIRKYRGAKQRLKKRFGIPFRIPHKVPSHNYSDWVRENMQPTIMDLLRSPEAAFRTYLNSESVDKLLQQHFVGQDNWEHLLGALCVFEIAHRLWVNPDPLPV